MPEKSKYDLKIQEKANYCINSALQAIFKSENLKISQDGIALNLEPSNKGFYLYGAKISHFLRDNGFGNEYSFENQTPFNEPDMLLKEIGNGHLFMGWKNHIRLVEDFKDPLVKYIDPKDGKTKLKELIEILSEMKKGKDGFFGLLKKIN